MSNDISDWTLKRQSDAIKVLLKSADKGLQLSEPNQLSEDAKIMLSALSEEVKKLDEDIDSLEEWGVF
jgi:hypothetical protein